ncbi:MAG: efflux RND transporter periplasmic adaptor subunit [bacterium]|nr:efflux RND transporter periplasmic adaptor subunit [bacterium]
MKNIITIITLLLLILGQTNAWSETGNEPHDEHNHSTITNQSSSQQPSQQPPTTDGAEIWTCPMHPQIKLPQPGQCPICGMNLIPLKKKNTGGASGVTTNNPTVYLSPETARLSGIKTTIAERRSIRRTVRLAGMIDFDETTSTRITAWVPGRIERMFVDYTGISVKKGEHLFEIYSPELISAQSELLSAAGAERKFGNDVSSSLNRSSRRSTVSAKEKLLLMGLSEKQLAHILSSGKVQNRLTIFSPTTGTVVKRHVAEGSYVKTGMPVYSIADLHTLWLQLEAYESDLPWLRYGQDVQFRSKAVPGKIFHGTIAFISPFTNQKTRTTSIRVNVDNNEMLLKPGMYVSAEVSTHGASDGRIIEEKLAGKFICPMHPDVVRDKAGTCDRCGMDLKSSSELGYETNPKLSDLPIIVPKTAVLQSGKRSIVFVYDDKTAHYTLREVHTGLEGDNYYAIIHGLKEGEVVVKDGAFKLDADLQLRGEPSLMSSEKQMTGTSSVAGHNH